LASSALQVQVLFSSLATMKRNYLAFVEDIPPYSGPKAARETYADLKRLSAIPGHIYTRPELQILPGQRRFSKMPSLVPMLELLPPTSIGHLKEWGLSTVFVLARNYNKLVHVWESVTAMAELWHPQTNSFIFPEFEATILLEELEIMLGLPRYQRGEELTISYTVEQINSWSILAYITTKKSDLYSMTSGMHVHLLPIAQWITSQCKRKTTNYTAITKAAAICICGVILFPNPTAVLGFLYAGLTSAALGGPFYGSVVALELWMGMHIQFRAVEDLTTECKTMRNHSLAYVGGRLHMSTRAWCKTAQLDNPLQDNPSAMEGGKDIGGDSSRRKRQAERRSSRRRMEEPPVEEEVPEVGMEEEEEEKMAPVANVEEERKRRAKAMKSHDPPQHGVAAGRGVGTVSWRLRRTRPYRGLDG
ncbi:hypothetical protein Taro_054126, partial [Colocasia esculenta]|nr:hypothetical protein [Colocasia esculenta]